ncbi:hypothetical protein Y032_0012g1825 [Ancylostoma ceylanicum]|uniref:7TM GPCR serpentine receptor class x (Srx) domain-containing protein n=1 Tax=Ancylostoma ceylanicum TaxID=53326 RepID=A0A016VDH5_9BILA|nr:hypothetical protein Y032_0012g1825 [Ancylostoma ceylanicum]
MITIGTAGFIVSITVIVQIMRAPAFHNAFGYLCISKLIADIAEFLINALWTGPATLLQLDESATNSFIGRTLAQLIFFFWIAVIYSHFQIAMNRMVANAYPTRYNWFYLCRG